MLINKMKRLIEADFNQQIAITKFGNFSIKLIFQYYTKDNKLEQ